MRHTCGSQCWYIWHGKQLALSVPIVLPKQAVTHIVDGPLVHLVHLWLSSLRCRFKKVTSDTTVLLSRSLIPADTDIRGFYIGFYKSYELGIVFTTSFSY